MVENKKQNKQTNKYAAGPCPKCGNVYYMSDRRQRRLFGTTRWRMSTRYYHRPGEPNLSDTFGMGQVCHVWE